MEIDRQLCRLKWGEIGCQTSRLVENMEGGGGDRPFHINKQKQGTSGGGGVATEIQHGPSLAMHFVHEGHVLHVADSVRSCHRCTRNLRPTGQDGRKGSTHSGKESGGRDVRRWGVVMKWKPHKHCKSTEIYSLSNPTRASPACWPPKSQMPNTATQMHNVSEA